LPHFLNNISPIPIFNTFELLKSRTFKREGLAAFFIATEENAESVIVLHESKMGEYSESEIVKCIISSYFLCLFVVILSQNFGAA